MRQLRVYRHRAKAKAKATLLWKDNIDTDVFTPSESERDVAFLIAYGPIGAKIALTFAFSFPRSH